MCENVFLAFTRFSKRTELCKKKQIFTFHTFAYGQTFIFDKSKAAVFLHVTCGSSGYFLFANIPLEWERGSNWSRSKRGDLWSKLDYKAPLKTTPTLTMFFIVFHLSGSSAETLHLKMKQILPSSLLFRHFLCARTFCSITSVLTLVINILFTIVSVFSWVTTRLLFTSVRPSAILDLQYYYRA